MKVWSLHVVCRPCVRSSFLLLSTKCTSLNFVGLPLKMLNVDGDSSEEDEEIDNEVAIKVDDSAIAPPVVPAGVTQPPPAAARPVLLQLGDEEEEEDEDAPIPILEPTSTTSAENAVETEIESVLKAQSEECAEALQAVESDQWDFNSWILFVEEVAEGRGGPITVDEAFDKFLGRFPRAAKYWELYAKYYTKRGDYSTVENIFQRCLSKCRNVELWKSYVENARLQGDRRSLETSLEKAIDSVGMSVDSYPVWRAHIDFIRDLPDSDPGKLSGLRKAYQRAVVVPMESLDIIWKEYEALEKQTGEHLAEKVLPEFNDKYLHAKAIFKERKRLVEKIDMDRPASPPTSSIAELQQLDRWNKWIKFEMTNPDNLSSQAHIHMLQLVFEQCLCSFLYHPEIWLSYGQFLHQHVGTSEARAIYREAIEAVPDVIALRIALAELEEGNGSKDAAKLTLRQAFERIPTAFTFAAYQRFVRRCEGISAARKVFSETLPIRRDAANERLAIDICMAHAQLELYVNTSPEVASKVLEMARTSYPGAINDVRFVQMMSRVLVRLGDLKQLRWIIQTALGDAALGVGPIALISGVNVTAATATASSSAQSSVSASASSGPSNVVASGFPELAAGGGRSRQQQLIAAGGRSAKDLLDLWEEYLAAETTLGLSDIARLNELREQRDKAKAAFEDVERSKQSGIVLGTAAADALFADAAAARVRGLFEGAYEIAERYDFVGPFTFEGADSSLRQRSRGRKYLDEVSQQESDRMAAIRDAGSRRPKRDRGGGGGGGGGDNRDRDDGNEGPAHLSGVPSVLREFLPKLPNHSGAVPDIEGFVRQLRTIVMPPRPASDESAESKRARIEGSTGAPAADWVHAMEAKNEDEEEEVEDETTGARDDVFRQRTRSRLGIP